MKIKIFLLIVIISCLLFIGCSLDEPAIDNSSNINNNIIEDKIEIKEDLKEDYSKYTGSYVTELSLKNDYIYGTSVNLEVDNNGKVQGIIGSSTENATHIANVEFKGKINNDELKVDFDNDGWNHCGTIYLKFYKDKLELNIEYDKSKSDDGNLWGIGEGSFILVKDDTKVNRTLDDLVNGGLLVNEEQSFDVDFENFGHVRFISGLKREDSIEKALFYLLDSSSNVLYKFKEFYGNDLGRFNTIEAVSFTDVNNDKLKDVIIISNYSINGAENHICGVYLQKDDSFILDKQFDEKMNKELQLKEIKNVLEYYKNNF